MMRLLLINPRFPESFWSFKLTVEKILPNKRTINPPLGLATLAALSPDDWEIEIIDENIETIPLNPKADVIGVCGMGVQFKRQLELLSFYKKKGFFTIAGGSYASLCPELYEGLVDSVIAGEAEYIWPQFCIDLSNGHPKALYHETGEVSLADSPTPRFDLLDLAKYQTVSLQFSRGCPFRCEFCDIIVMFGRKPRTKTMDQVGRELDLLRSMDIHNAFFVDDNLIGNKPVAKELLAFLADYQDKHDYRFHFGTEASLNLAQDEELLRRFKKAHFQWVFIGIESPDEESLKETKKYQNMRGDMLSSIRKVYSYGIEVFAGFIVGFDNDTNKIFDKQFEFVMNSGIQAAMIGLLTALPKTPLYERLEREGRLISDANSSDNTKLSTNIIPKQMSYDEMVRGYSDLYFRLLDPGNIAERIKNKLDYLVDPNRGSEHSAVEHTRILFNFIIHGLRPGGLTRIYHFLRSLPLLKPKLIPLVIEEWIVALAMRDYVDRHFVHEFDHANQLTHEYLGHIERVFNRYVKGGSLEVSLGQVKNAAANISIRLSGMLGRDFFNRAGRHLEKVLEDTTSSVTIHIEELHEAHLKHLNQLLSRLSQYGDRIYIRVHERIRHIVEIDSSVFNLILETS